MAKSYYRGAVAAVVCFDLTEKATYDKSREWVANILETEPVNIIAFKVHNIQTTVNKRFHASSHLRDPCYVYCLIWRILLIKAIVLYCYGTFLMYVYHTCLYMYIICVYVWYVFSKCIHTNKQVLTSKQLNAIKHCRYIERTNISSKWYGRNKPLYETMKVNNKPCVIRAVIERVAISGWNVDYTWLTSLLLFYVYLFWLFFPDV